VGFVVVVVYVFCKHVAFTFMFGECMIYIAGKGTSLEY